MIELHSHVLFDMDDGAADQDQSVALLMDYQAQGVTDIVCTPHVLPKHWQSRETIDTYLDKRDRLIRFLSAICIRRQISIRLHAGAELMLTSDCLIHLRDPMLVKRLVIRGGTYILVELPRFLSGGVDQLENLLFSIQMAGLTPILAHPERTAHNEGVLETFASWVDKGRLLMQINAGSLIDDPRISPERQARYRRRRDICHQMLERNMVQFIASDAHDPVERPPQNQIAFQAIEQKYGSSTAQLLMVDNPFRVTKDKAVARQIR